MAQYHCNADAVIDEDAYAIIHDWMSRSPSKPDVRLSKEGNVNRSPVSSHGSSDNFQAMEPVVSAKNPLDTKNRQCAPKSNACNPKVEKRPHSHAHTKDDRDDRRNEKPTIPHKVSNEPKYRRWAPKPIDSYSKESKEISPALNDRDDRDYTEPAKQRKTLPASISQESTPDEALITRLSDELTIAMHEKAKLRKIMAEKDDEILRLHELNASLFNAAEEVKKNVQMHLKGALTILGKCSAHLYHEGSLVDQPTVDSPPKKPALPEPSYYYGHSPYPAATPFASGAPYPYAAYPGGYYPGYPMWPAQMSHEA